jgi:ABC-type spermidine/putrescine transport system permease subunit I
MQTIEQLVRIGWRIVEIALLLVILCLLLSILLGNDGGAFINTVAANARRFLQDVPPGSFLGVVLILLLYWYFRSRRSD